jgi:Rad3-related DNA helicase
MTKLPYGAPSRYMYAQQARLGYGVQRNTIYLPKALAMFRQGCGRLLRSESDRGSITILDKRVLDGQHANFLEDFQAVWMNGICLILLGPVPMNA